jgi:ABC-type multidrug transport system fused ATPase/permease subunit
MNPTDYYSSRALQAEENLRTAKRQLVFIAMARLFIFLLVVLLAWFFFQSGIAFGLTIVCGTAAFLFFVSLYTNIRHRRDYYDALVTLNRNELEALKGNLKVFSPGIIYADPHHYYSMDMDLFGEISLFRSINRSATQKGEQLLAGFVTANSINDIPAKQSAIKELAAKPDWRQDFRVHAQLIGVQVQTQKIVDWMKAYKRKLPGVLYVLSFVFTAISVITVALAAVGLIDWELVMLPFFSGLLISGLFFTRVTRISQQATHLANSFNRYARLLELIEDEKFEAGLLVTRQAEIRSEGEKASRIFARLGSDLSNLDQRNNIFFALFANGFMLWDLRFAAKVEAWIGRHDKMVEACFEVVAFFDAYGSFANYAFNHPDYVYPDLAVQHDRLMVVKNLGHPLIAPERRITNDFEMGHGRFMIITGANMAGKSTFLRTVGSAIIMANCGLPVCAASFVYAPIKLISSMRSSDSLQNDESYFFAELKRLRFIVDQLSDDRYFIILDEILKGTNSKDKEEGSKKFVRRLVNSGSVGIIATHDLSLCQLENEFPTVENHYFDAEIVNDELFFDYRFKTGVCHNMNASFLLRKMGIVEE